MMSESESLNLNSDLSYSDHGSDFKLSRSPAIRVRDYRDRDPGRDPAAVGSCIIMIVVHTISPPGFPIGPGSTTVTLQHGRHDARPVSSCRTAAGAGARPGDCPAQPALRRPRPGDWH